MSDIINVNFKPTDGYYKRAGREDLTQWNYGQILRITGLELPDPVEIHFSLDEKDGEAPVLLGRTVDGATEVEIPPFIMEGPEYIASDYYKAYAFIYPSNEEYGETIKKIELSIRARSKPADWIPPDNPTTLGEVLDMINGKVEKTGHEPNKFLGTDENGNVVTKDQKEYELPVASEDTLGGVKPVTKTEDMTQSVGADKEGRLFTKPSGIDEETFLKLAIKPTTEKATFHNIQDSANYRILDFEMDGKTEQETTEGNQLFDISTSQGFVSLYTGLSSEIDVENNTITTTNTHTTDRTGHLDLGILKAGTYYLSYNNDNGYGTTASISKGELSGLTRIAAIPLAGGAFTLEEECHCWMVWVVKNTIPLKLSNIMLNLGSTVLPYEPYTGGAASPNPQYQQEIVNAGVYDAESGMYKVDVEVVNKNEFKPTIKSTYQSTANLDGDKYVIVNTAITGVAFARSELFALKKDITYRFSLHDCVNLDKAILWQDGDTSKALGVFSKSYTLTYTPTEDIMAGLGIYMTDISTLGNLTECRIQVEKSTVATAYIQHQSQQITLTSERPITKWDKLEKRDGVYGWSINSIREYEVTGKETFFMSVPSTTYYTGTSTNAYFEPNDLAKSKTYTERYVYCEELSYISAVWSLTDGSVGIANNDNQMHMRFPNTLLGVADDATRDEKLSAYKAYLQQRYADGNPVKIQYKTENEVEFIPLPQEEQDALKAIETYYGVTNVWNDQDCPIQIQYVADSQLYVDNKLLAIQSAVI